MEEKKLKFLVLAKFRSEAIYAVGEPEPAAFMEELTAGYETAIGILEDIGQPEGFFERIYGRVGGGWVGIVQADSHKELWEKLTGDKAFYSFFEWHIEPLIEVDNTRENRKNIFPLLMSAAGGGWG